MSAESTKHLIYLLVETGYVSVEKKETLYELLVTLTQS